MPTTGPKEEPHTQLLPSSLSSLPPAAPSQPHVSQQAGQPDPTTYISRTTTPPRAASQAAESQAEKSLSPAHNPGIMSRLIHGLGSLGRSSSSQTQTQSSAGGGGSWGSQPLMTQVGPGLGMFASQAPVPELEEGSQEHDHDQEMD